MTEETTNNTPAEPAKEASAEQPNTSEDAIKAEVDKVLKQVETEDKAKLDSVRDELAQDFSAKLRDTQEGAAKVIASQITDLKKQLSEEYNQKVMDLTKSIEEYTGRKGLVEQPKANPINEGEQAPTPTETPKPVDINDISRDEDLDLAQQFIKSLK